MYPTVNSLMGLWRFVIAQEIKVVENCKDEIEAFLGRVRADDLFKPASWKHLTAFVRIIPDGDMLPTRAKYSPVSNDWQVAVNHELWFSLPDVVASVIKTGRVPKIVDAFRIEPVGTMPGLNSTKLRGSIEIDRPEAGLFRAGRWAVM